MVTAQLCHSLRSYIFSTRSPGSKWFILLVQRKRRVMSWIMHRFYILSLSFWSDEKDWALIFTHLTTCSCCTPDALSVVPSSEMVTGYWTSGCQSEIILSSVRYRSPERHSPLVCLLLLQSGQWATEHLGAVPGLCTCCQSHWLRGARGISTVHTTRWQLTRRAAGKM